MLSQWHIFSLKLCQNVVILWQTLRLCIFFKSVHTFIAVCLCARRTNAPISHAPSPTATICAPKKQDGSKNRHALQRFTMVIHRCNEFHWSNRRNTVESEIRWSNLCDACNLRRWHRQSHHARTRKILQTSPCKHTSKANWRAWFLWHSKPNPPPSPAFLTHIQKQHQSRNSVSTHMRNFWRPCPCSNCLSRKVQFR